MNFRIGCTLKSYKGRVGDFYPPTSRSTEFLHLYSQRFTTALGNTTFYAVPDANTLARWVAQTPQWLRQGTRLYFFVHCPVEEQ